MMKLIINEPGLRFNEWLVITDLHIGYERAYRAEGYYITNQLSDTINRIKSLKGDSKKLMILGDVKHNIPLISWQEEKEVPELLDELNNTFNEVVIIKGNHDGGIERLTPAVKELIIDNNAFIHGHSISKEALKCDKIIAGHMHPVYNFKNHLGISEPRKCWVISDKVVIMPAFTNLSSGSNELAKPLNKLIKEKEVLLLDHTKVE